MINCSAISNLSFNQVSQADMGILSCLPNDVLTVMMDYLPIHDVMALHQSRKNVCSIVEKTLYAKIQTTLELTVNKLFANKEVNRGLDKECILNNFERIKDLTANTKEKCEALREHIFSILKEYDSKRLYKIDNNDLTAVCRQMQDHSPRNPLLSDPLLLSYVISRLAGNEVGLMDCYFKGIAHCLNMIAKGVLKINSLSVVSIQGHFDEKFLKLLTKVISSNPFLQTFKVDYGHLCNLKQTNLILSSARKNSELKHITLKQNNFYSKDISKDKYYKPTYRKLHLMCETYLEGNNFEDKKSIKTWTWNK